MTSQTDGLDLVPVRRLLVDRPQLRFALRPGDHALVEAGEAVRSGEAIADRVLDPELDTVDGGRPGEAAPGSWWSVPAGVLAGRLRRRSGEPSSGEVLFESGGRLHVVAGEHRSLLETPVSGIVRSARSGIGIGIDADEAGLQGALAAGQPTRGDLVIADRGSGAASQLLHVGHAGSIVVVESRVDAETLTRARAMGLRGVVVSGIGWREMRDMLASERRQRASLHQLAPFAVLALDGVTRRPIASPIRALLQALAGREVAIVTDPPLLLFDRSDLDLPAIAPDLVRVRHGPDGGREGRWDGSGGPRRFEAGVHREAGHVVLDDGRRVAVPLADLERFA